MFRAVSSYIRASRPPHRLHIPLPLPRIALIKYIQIGLLAVTVGFTGITAWWWQQMVGLEDEAARYETAASRIAVKNRELGARLLKEGVPVTSDAIVVVKREIAFANMLAQKREFSWIRLLSDLEETVPPHIAINSVRLDFQNSNVTVQGMAKNLHDVNRWVKNLEEHGAFREAALQDHHLQENQASPILRFQMTVGYRPSF